MAEQNQGNPEIGKTVLAGGIKVNYHDYGEGDSVVFIHGSGPGVTAWSNWRLVLPKLAPHRRVIAPDMVGFGYTNVRRDLNSIWTWGNQLIDFSTPSIQKLDMVGIPLAALSHIWMAIRIRGGCEVISWARWDRVQDLK
jgi:2-hydroxymuconate-semialdehyde hydrolase